MSRDRIILAAEDIPYLVSLQNKFTEELFNLIDLEVITDRSYFSEFLSVPQEAQVLIVSEKLYVPQIRKHRFGQVFLLTEEPGEKIQPDDGLNRIYKYTSIKEIYSEVISRSTEVLRLDRETVADPRILLVTSATGGAGKTTVAMGLCASLVRGYKRVLYLNCEKLQTFQLLMHSQAPLTEEEAYTALMHPTQDLYAQIRHCIRTDRYHYLPPLPAPQMSLGISMDAYMRVAEGARKSMDYDYIVVDTDSVFDEDKARFLDLADRVFIVTEQSPYHAQACSRFISNIAGLSPEKYFFVCNKYSENRENALTDPQLRLCFTVNEYVRAADSYENFCASGFSGDEGMERVRWLLN